MRDLKVNTRKDISNQVLGILCTPDEPVGRQPFNNHRLTNDVIGCPMYPVQLDGHCHMEQDTPTYSVEVTDMMREENNRGERHILRGRQISKAIDFGCARCKRLSFKGSIRLI